LTELRTAFAEDDFSTLGVPKNGHPPLLDACATQVVVVCAGGDETVPVLRQPEPHSVVVVLPVVVV
jgi:hypothetical protein